MYICYNDNNTPIDRVKTEKEAQKVCSKLGSYYRKDKFNFFFWRIPKDIIVNTIFGFLTYKEVMQKVKDLVKERYNTNKHISFEELIPILEELFGDNVYTFLKRRFKDHISV